MLDVLNETAVLALKVGLIEHTIINNSDEELLSEMKKQLPFVAKILQKKVEVFQPNIKVSTCTFMLFDALSESNPGFVQIMFLDTIAKMNKSDRNDITVEKCFYIFNTSFPKVRDYDAAYDYQKVERGNLIDCAEFWNDVFESENETIIDIIERFRKNNVRS